MIRDTCAAVAAIHSPASAARGDHGSKTQDTCRLAAPLGVCCKLTSADLASK